MIIIGIIALIAIILILSIPLHKLLNKLFKVEKKSILDTPGKRIDRWGRGVIAVIFIGSLPFVFSMEGDWAVIRWYFISLVIVQNGFQAFLEWKYLNSTNKYKVTFVDLLINSIVIFYMYDLFNLFSK